ncbi:hypothetical protein E6O75_ATG06929 [Venturia nashicola]|uniref:Uncharacterized protein n=1 Tax=Venturia nashicola TaxID=86259 RepID=A0A4Z1PE57_9PEZI|nr:hypothetical protein E6O75_ATG06929 [Venturia nashicola]
MSFFQSPKKRQRISPLANYTRGRPLFKRVPSSLLPFKSSIDQARTSLDHLSLMSVEIVPKPALSRRPPRFDLNPGSENSSTPPPITNLKRTAPSMDSGSDGCFAKRRQSSRAVLRVYQSRTTFFSLPRELRQAILIQAVDSTRLHECARQYRDRKKDSQGGACKHTHRQFCCHYEHGNEAFRMWQALVDVKMPQPRFKDWSWWEEVDFVWEKWQKEMKSARDCAFSRRERGMDDVARVE